MYPNVIRVPADAEMKALSVVNPELSKHPSLKLKSYQSTPLLALELSKYPFLEALELSKHTVKL